jgi:hypothetical protein
MSLVLAMKTNDNIYFASESLSGKGVVSVSLLDNFIEEKFSCFELSNLKIIIGSVGKATIKNTHENLANMINDYLSYDNINKLNSSEVSNLFRNYIKYINKEYAELFVGKENKTVSPTMCIGIKYKKHDIEYNQLFLTETEGYVREIIEFGAIGVCQESAYCLYENLDKGKDPRILLSKIINSCSRYEPLINNSISITDINSFRLFKTVTETSITLEDGNKVII